MYRSKVHLPCSFMYIAFEMDFLSFFIGDKKCECSCKDGLFGAIIGILVFIIIVLIIYILWLHKKGDIMIFSFPFATLLRRVSAYLILSIIVSRFVF